MFIVLIPPPPTLFCIDGGTLTSTVPRIHCLQTVLYCQPHAEQLWVWPSPSSLRHSGPWALRAMVPWEPGIAATGKYYNRMQLGAVLTMMTLSRSLSLINVLPKIKKVQSHQYSGKAVTLNQTKLWDVLIHIMYRPGCLHQIMHFNLTNKHLSHTHCMKVGVWLYDHQTPHSDTPTFMQWVIALVCGPMVTVLFQLIDLMQAGYI